MLAGRDNPGITGQAGPLGWQFRDLGHAHLAPGAAHPAYDSQPPTSGAHIPLAITRDQGAINDDQLLEALELGDVVLFYGGDRPPLGLQALADSIAAPFTPALAAAGQAVILARRPGTNGVLGAAWTRLVQVRTPADPALRSFMLLTLGQGAPAH
ncbi:MAG: DUF3105 domain-containing protein [Solirubrobacteraceae bacterium]